MRGTALERGLKSDWYVDERADPEKATRAAASYLRTLRRTFGGDWCLALASYNGGPGLVRRAMKRSGLDNFWALASAKRRYLPRETREYVPMILAAIIIARNPAQFGFSIDPEPPVEVESVKVPGPVDLRRVAEWTGTSIDEIRLLNPELRRWTTPMRYPDYQIKVPKGTGVSLADRLNGAATSDVATLNWYSVKRGESLASIAKKLKVSRTDLAEANYLKAQSRVTAGQQLIIPREPTGILAAHAERPLPVAESRDVAAGPRLMVQAPKGEPSEAGRLIHLVRSGDTLFSIARLYRTTVSAIMAWNHLRGSLINIGDQLTIFAKASAGGQH